MEVLPVTVLWPRVVVDMLPYEVYVGRLELRPDVDGFCIGPSEAPGLWKVLGILS